MTDIEVFKIMWPWVNEHLGALHRMVDVPNLPKSAKVAMEKEAADIADFAGQMSQKYGTEVRNILLENR